ncbi:uncharacterized protein H6S33_008207 [Morchella sextelata]|uniref:uncharacterized protein n=1 Tax=Morchella sextelata TaxID=1174677 RepID=UPI001D048448|nr:uncharacterized protein H6S33_008207 [Morchella sextelata]KAH0603203.1 hypothetical protein H6S33_008207 [Morchella sextelata]
MKLGQGYNTYVQQTCVEDAVTITPQEPGGSEGVKKSYDAVLIEDYNQLTRSLQISGSAAISGWGASLEIDTTFLNRTEFETSDITYQVLVQGKKQTDASSKVEFNWYEPSDAHEKYGDRYIADFITGGTFFARISIKAGKKHKTEEIKASAKLAFSCFKVGASVTTEVESAMKTISQHSGTNITMHSEGSRKHIRGTPENLLALKRKADDALLGQYEKLPNFKDQFKPMNYSYATQKSWEIFDTFSRYVFFEDMIEKVPINKFVNGAETRRALLNSRIDEMVKIQAKVLSVKADPTTVNEPGEFQDADSFRLRILVYIFPVQCLNSATYTRFSLKVFDFSAMLGTTLISFGLLSGFEETGPIQFSTSGEHVSN